MISAKLNGRIQHGQYLSGEVPFPKGKHALFPHHARNRVPHAAVLKDHLATGGHPFGKLLCALHLQHTRVRAVTPLMMGQSRGHASKHKPHRQISASYEFKREDSTCHRILIISSGATITRARPPANAPANASRERERPSPSAIPE